MIKRSLRQWCLLACLAVATELFSITGPAQSATRPPRLPAAVHVTIKDTGKTVALPVGDKLIVMLPLRPYDDNTWYVASNTGSGLKLIVGPDERRPRNWEPRKYSTQIFYFQRESPGTAHLVLEQKYYSRPMLLKVVDP